MCGFCGIAFPEGRTVEAGVLRRMTEAMAHRGPDGEGTFLDGNIGLGHRRLSLIDLEGGQQPMNNEDGSVVVVFNGEIYNFESLTRDLVRQGHRFRTRSDTETLVHLYEQHGTDMFSMLRGMFAFALWDQRRRVLYLVRDRYGIKPVYYHQRGGTLLFASEVKPLIAAGYTVDVNPHAIHAYLQTRFAHGDETIFRGVYRLPEGHYLRWSHGEVAIAPYYSTPGHEFGLSLGDAKHLFEETLADAVASHMIADVPVGAYLSAGVDSSVLVSEMVRRTSKPVRTFCVDFAGSNGDSEAPVAEETARRLGCEHTTVTCGVEQLLELPAVVRTLEEPVGDAIVVAQYCLSRATRQAGIKTVLTGDGADETLGGYPYLRAIVKAARWRQRLPAFVFRRLAVPLAKRLPLGVVQHLAGLPFDVAREARERLVQLLRALPGSDLRALYDLLLALYRPRQLRELYTDAFYARIGGDSEESFAGEPAGTSVVERVLSMQYRKWLPANINLKQDKLCMAHSVENRVPFLDHLFVELAASLPAHCKIRGRTTKVILRDYAHKRLPPRVSAAPKRPFHIPLAQFLKDPRVRGLVEDNLRPERVLRRGLFRPAYVGQLVDRGLTGDFMHAKRMFALVILELWYRNFVDGERL